MRAKRSLAPIVVMVGFALSCVGLLLFLWSSFGGPVPLRPQAYVVHASFAQGSQLASYADVRISGVSVGKVRSVERRGGLARVRIEIEPRYAPLPRSTRAALRSKTLVGEAFVALSFGDRRGPQIPDGGAIATGQVQRTVEIDGILDAFDAPTRRHVRRMMTALGRDLRGRGRDLNGALARLPATVQRSSTLLGVLDQRQTAVRSLTRDASTTFDAAGRDAGALQALVRRARSTFGVLADEQRSLERAVELLPATLRTTRAVMQDADRLGDDLAVAVPALRPAVRQLPEALDELARFAPVLRDVLRAAGPLVTAADTGIPALDRLLAEVPSAMAQIAPALADAIPAVDYLWDYRRDVASTFTAGAAAGASRSRGPRGQLFNMARVTTVLNSDILGGWRERSAANRGTAYPHPENMRDLDRGLAAWSCANASRPPTLLSVLDVTGIQPCREQGPRRFGDRLSMFPSMRPATPPASRSRPRG
ncbi:MlaD family protein [Patulibacter medicamentivorans]|uniref:MlaD family protein n=1 Tax=Patulibacter medicamentivorans TaxID=1097667 RepID=UPI0011106FEB|nr:MlaD family protein [Patulibacter medicamentivorans]